MCAIAVIATVLLLFIFPLWLDKVWVWTYFFEINILSKLLMSTLKACYVCICIIGTNQEQKKYSFKCNFPGYYRKCQHLIQVFLLLCNVSYFWFKKNNIKALRAKRFSIRHSKLLVFCFNSSSVPLNPQKSI